MCTARAHDPLNRTRAHAVLLAEGGSNPLGFFKLVLRSKLVHQPQASEGHQVKQFSTVQPQWRLSLSLPVRSSAEDKVVHIEAAEVHLSKGTSILWSPDVPGLIVTVQPPEALR